jgi:hypothetical protein
MRIQPPIVFANDATTAPSLSGSGICRLALDHQPLAVSNQLPQTIHRKGGEREPLDAPGRHLASRATEADSTDLKPRQPVSRSLQPGALGVGTVALQQGVYEAAGSLWRGGVLRV